MPLRIFGKRNYFAHAVHVNLSHSRFHMWCGEHRAPLTIEHDGVFIDRSADMFNFQFSSGYWFTMQCGWCRRCVSISAFLLRFNNNFFGSTRSHLHTSSVDNNNFFAAFIECAMSCPWHILMLRCKTKGFSFAFFHEKSNCKYASFNLFYFLFSFRFCAARPARIQYFVDWISEFLFMRPGNACPKLIRAHAHSRPTTVSVKCIHMQTPTGRAVTYATDNGRDASGKKIWQTQKSTSISWCAFTESSGKWIAEAFATE